MTTLAIDHPEKTLPEGCAMRPARQADLPGVVDLLNASFESLVGAGVFSIGEMSRNWGMPGFNLEEDSQVVLDEQGRLAGYCDVFDFGTTHVRPDALGRVHPDDIGRGFGSALLAWAEQRAHRSLLLAPVEARVVLISSLPSVDEKGLRLHEAAGFKLVRRSLRMSIELDGDLSQPAWPAGVSVRRFVLEQDDEATVRAVRESFADHWGYVERPFETELIRYRHRWATDKDFDPNLCFLAIDGDEVAGISLCYPKAPEDVELGWVETLGVRRPWRRRGLGLALLLHSFHELKRYGKKRVSLGVDAQSLTGATRLYEKAGMHSLPRWEWSHFEKELRAGVELSTQSVVS